MGEEGNRIGVLAFGSLIGDSGELDSVTAKRVDVTTPFPVEFARSSSRRDGGPTLVPVTEGGAKVTAVVLVLKASVSISAATDMLYRRETNQVGSEIKYPHKADPSPDDVVVEEIKDFGSCDVVLYTRIGTNIQPLTATKLAEMAIASAKKRAGAEHRDGISYMSEAKQNGIVTALGPAYEAEVLAQTNSGSLDAAWLVCRQSVEHR